MNYGFDRPDVRESASVRARNSSQRYGLQFYHYVASGANLLGKDVLEVGCGRGGGAEYIARVFRPRKLVAVDINVSAIRFDKSHYSKHDILTLELRMLMLSHMRQFF